MSLYDQIMKLYPEISPADFALDIGTIVLQNDSDGLGDYIKAWNHPTLPHPPFGQDPHSPPQKPATRK